MPEWFMQRLTEVYVRENALAIAASQLEPPTIDLTVKADAEGWAERLGGQVLPTGSVRLDRFRGSVTALEGFDDGAWWVQDAAAAIPANCSATSRASGLPISALPRVARPRSSCWPAETCSPSNNRRHGSSGWRAIWRAWDFRPTRSARTCSTSMRPRVSTPSCSMPPARRRVRHGVIRMCSGPRMPATSPNLPHFREKLLRHAVSLLKPGGRLVFSNCSIDPSEGEDVVDRVLADMPGLRLVAINPSDWPGLETAITPRGEFRTTPAMLAKQVASTASTRRSLLKFN